MEFFNFDNPHFLIIFLVVVILLAVFEMVCKGFALWKSAKNNQAAWFVCILIINTAGILPIIYLLLNRNKKSL